MSNAIFWFVVSFVIVMYIRIHIDEGGGGVAIKNSDKYKKYQEEADRKVEDLLRNKPQSSKEELMEWWDDHHKKD